MSNPTSEVISVLRGTILSFDKIKKTLLISGENNKRYNCDYSEWKEDFFPEKGNKVEFSINEQKIVDIYSLESVKENKQGNEFLIKYFPYISLFLFAFSFFLFFDIKVYTIYRECTIYVMASDYFRNNWDYYPNKNSFYVITLTGLSLLMTLVFSFIKPKLIRISSVILTIFILIFYLMISKDTDSLSGESRLMAGYWELLFLIIINFLYSLGVLIICKIKKIT